MDEDIIKEAADNLTEMERLLPENQQVQLFRQNFDKLLIEYRLSEERLAAVALGSILPAFAQLGDVRRQGLTP